MTGKPASILLRVIAYVYDAIVVIAVLMLAVAVAFIVNGTLHNIIPLHFPDNQHLHQLLIFKIYLASVWFIFYGYFVTKSGQTLGLKAWRIKIESLTGAKVSWKQASLRFICALGGLMIVTGLFSRSKIALHDKLSGTRLYRYPKS